jgi:hypothetical protein
MRLRPTIAPAPAVLPEALPLKKNLNSCVTRHRGIESSFGRFGQVIESG